MKLSSLYGTVCRVAARSASATVARSRIASQALNAVLLRRLTAKPGARDALLADPIFEAKCSWETSDYNLDDLGGDLLHSDLVDALDCAEKKPLHRDCHPYVHQVDAWRLVQSGRSCLVSSGTGSGKTECFMLPILDDLLRDSAQGKLVGVRAIIIYPLNALIESQRERLSDWTNAGALSERVTFALYNGLTPETPREVDRGCLSAAELGDRRTIRQTPPAILVTNVTMLEYLLLRAQDRNILEQSRGLLRWIVLDEAHSYIGAQAAEMTLLLRRVRAAFGVSEKQVRLIATSATISEGERTKDKLERFVSALAGVGKDCVRVIEGKSVDPTLPAPGADVPLDTEAILALESSALWEYLAPHPRIQKLIREMSKRGVALQEVATILYGLGNSSYCAQAQAVLDAAAQARHPTDNVSLLPWRAHVFHRALGGFWACVDQNCSNRDPELAAKNSDWKFGAVWFTQRDRCECGAPVFELYVCRECRKPCLIACMHHERSSCPRLVPANEIEVDDFLVDVEPDEESDIENLVSSNRVVLFAEGGDDEGFLRVEDGSVFVNDPPKSDYCVPISWVQEETARPACCASTAKGATRYELLRYGPPFLMGASMPTLIEALGQSLGRPGLPMGGRRAITFSDSRQGVARLAAKLQRDAERSLTRSFLYHAVQEDDGLGDEERAKIEELLAFLSSKPDAFSDLIQEKEKQLSRNAVPIMWDELVRRFARQTELENFATQVWNERRRGGREMAEDPSLLAKMFLYRELFRRPKIQNNAETMGLLRLSFPRLEEKARNKCPSVFGQIGLSTDDWIGLVLATVDFVFRDKLAIEIPDSWMARLISPKGGRSNSIYRQGTNPEDQLRRDGLPWPDAKPQPGNPSRIHRLVYGLLNADWENAEHQDHAREIFGSLWELISKTAAKDIGGGAYQLDFKKAAVVRLEHGWLCPVTQRIFGYSPAGLSPYGPSQKFSEVKLPRLPCAHAGGLDSNSRVTVANWCETNPEVQYLRHQGLWADLHDRVAVYTRFFRAQEHSAQIERAVLAGYEEQFKNGSINLLNCSTTMEMGVDIPDIQLVVNSNVPPSVSNYRQRVGRAGRGNAPWAIGITFCRNLPLDQIVFRDPNRFLESEIAAPSVVLDSRRLVLRHVNAALLAAYFRNFLGGVSIRSSAGFFFGATEDFAEPINVENCANRFLAVLQEEAVKPSKLISGLGQLIQGTALAKWKAGDLIKEAEQEFDKLRYRWCAEYIQLLERSSAAKKSEVQQAFQFRARRMKGEFLLGELARRGFTPSYGFPIDVVAFDHLSGHERRREMRKDYISFGEHRGAASRTLDVAVREYAPGAEVVVDGLVHRSDGILPAWEAKIDASGIEDLQNFWECEQCHFFGLTRLEPPDSCPECGSHYISRKRSLRPAGFLGRHEPHTGYESLGYVPYEMPQISVSENMTWKEFSVPRAGRFRYDHAGQVITFGSGRYGKGYALCLICGRAEAEEEDSPASMLKSMHRHRPLAEAYRVKTVDGHCPGGFTEPHRVQRNVHLFHEVHTDVFELQVPNGIGPAEALGLVSGMRETLAKRLGIEVREIGVAVGRSLGPDGRKRVSAFLYDRASGGAGLSTRLADIEWFMECLKNAVERLDCPEQCDHGCPVCVLRPDLNFGVKIDRVGALHLTRNIYKWLNSPGEGPEKIAHGGTVG